MLEATRNPLNVTTHDPTTNSNGGRLATADTPVIVLNWNGWEYTFACLQSLRAAEDVTTVWLVDNGSLVDRTDETRTLWPGLRVVRLDQNYGFAGGMNQALRLAASEGYAFAYLLNNDATVVPGFLRAALDAVAPGVAVVGSRIAYADGRSIAFDGEYYAKDERSVDEPFETRPVPHANGAGMLVRLAALAECGYFDERFFCYHEEVELCWRLAARGCASIVAANSFVRHVRGGSDVNANSVYCTARGTTSCWPRCCAERRA